MLNFYGRKYPRNIKNDQLKSLNDFEFFAGINNLFDRKYNDNIRINAWGKRYYEPAPMRNFYFGVSYAF